MNVHGAVFDSACRVGYLLLSCFPEDMAIQYGQLALKKIPIEYFSPASPRSCATIAGVELPSPLVLASYYKDSAIWEKAFALGFGAVTTKTTTLRERPRKPHTVVRRGKGFVNSEGYPNYGLDKTKREIDGFRSRYSGDGKLIVSIGAMEDVEEYITLARHLGPFADFIEVNGSSPNNEIAYSMSGEVYCVEKVSKGVREATTKPVIWKLSPDHVESNIRTVIPLIIGSGIEAVEWGNTRRTYDWQMNGYGALSGPELYDGMIENVRCVHSEFGNYIDVIGGGGVDSVEKAMRVLMHTNGVAMLSGFVHDIGLPRRINESLTRRNSYAGFM